MRLSPGALRKMDSVLGEIAVVGDERLVREGDLHRVIEKIGFDVDDSRLCGQLRDRLQDVRGVRELNDEDVFEIGNLPAARHPGRPLCEALPRALGALCCGLDRGVGNSRSDERSALTDGAVAQEHRAQRAAIPEVQRFRAVVGELQDELVGAEGLARARLRVFGCWRGQADLDESDERQEGAAQRGGDLGSELRCGGESSHAVHQNPLD